MSPGQERPSSLLGDGRSVSALAGAGLSRCWRWGRFRAQAFPTAVTADGGLACHSGDWDSG